MEMCKNEQASTSVKLPNLPLSKYPRPPHYQVPGPLSWPWMAQPHSCIHEKLSRIASVPLAWPPHSCIHEKPSRTASVPVAWLQSLETRPPALSLLPTLRLSIFTPNFIPLIFFPFWKAFPQSSMNSPFLPFGSAFKCYHIREVFSSHFK